MIWILKVELYFGAYTEKPWEGNFEIETTNTLEDLHFAINKAINFDDDHMYEFYISRTVSSRNKIRFDDENEEIYDRTIESLYPLKKGMKLFYLFDYGDNWLFKITKSRKKPYIPTEGIEYPKLLKSIGTIPEQYPNYND
jgi:hypothetical protein